MASPMKESSTIDKYESPYSVRQIKKQTQANALSQPKPPKERQTMKQFLTLMNNKDSQGMSVTQSQMFDRTLKSHRNSNLSGKLDSSARFNSSHMSPRIHDSKQDIEPGPYQKLLESERPKRSEMVSQANSIMVNDENYAKEKLTIVNQKLQEEEGFSKEELETVNQNMIFFKSVAEVKKRQQDMKQRMNPNNVRNTHSKISAHFKRRGDNNTTMKSHSTYSGAQNFRSPQRDQSNLFSSSYGNSGQRGKAAKDIEIEQILDQHNNAKITNDEQLRMSTNSNPFTQAQDTFNQQNNQSFNYNYTEQKQSTLSNSTSKLDTTLKKNNDNNKMDYKVEYVHNSNEKISSNSQQLQLKDKPLTKSDLTKNEAEKSQSISNEANNNQSKERQDLRSSIQRSSIPRGIGSQASSPMRLSQVSQIGLQSPKKPHHQEVTEAYLSKIRPENYDEGEKEENSNNTTQRTNKKKHQPDVYGMRNSTLSLYSSLRPVKEGTQRTSNLNPMLLNIQKDSIVNQFDSSQQHYLKETIITQQEEVKVEIEEKEVVREEIKVYNSQSNGNHAHHKSGDARTGSNIRHEDQYDEVLHLGINTQDSINDGMFSEGDKTHDSKSSLNQGGQHHKTGSHVLKDGQYTSIRKTKEQQRQQDQLRKAQNKEKSTTSTPISKKEDAQLDGLVNQLQQNSISGKSRKGALDLHRHLDDKQRSACLTCSLVKKMQAERMAK